jgi:hypothetical protein
MEMMTLMNTKPIINPYFLREKPPRFVQIAFHLSLRFMAPPRRDLPGTHDQDAVADRDDLLDLGGDEQDAGPLVGELPHDPVDLGFRAHVDPPRRLIHDQDSRLREQPLADHRLLLVATTQEFGLLVVARSLDVGTCSIRPG